MVLLDRDWVPVSFILPLVKFAVLAQRQTLPLVQNAPRLTRILADAKIGDDVKRELGKLNIVWTDISADVLQNEIQEQLRAAKVGLTRDQIH